MGVFAAYMKILEQYKSQESELHPADREKLRTEMLSYLLFSPNSTTGASPTANRGIAGLSENEKELIRKLAASTDSLHRLMNNSEPDNQ